MSFNRPPDLDEIRERSDRRFGNRREMLYIPPTPTEHHVRALLKYVDELEQDLHFSRKREEGNRRGVRVEYALPHGCAVPDERNPKVPAVPGPVRHHVSPPAEGSPVQIGGQSFVVKSLAWFIDPADPRNDSVRVNLWGVREYVRWRNRERRAGRWPC